MAPYLKIRRPSPTTAYFTVSNASQSSSTLAKVLFYLQFLLRAVIFVSVLCIATARLRSTFFWKNGPYVHWTAVWSSPTGQLACRIADAYSSFLVGVVSALVIYGIFRKGYTGTTQFCIRTMWQVGVDHDCCSFRGVAPGNTGPGYPDVYFFEHISIQSYYAIHPHHSNPGYRDS